MCVSGRLLEVIAEATIFSSVPTQVGGFGAAPMVLLELARLLVREEARSYAVTLRAPSDGRTLSFEIGAFEAAAIEFALDERPSPRPLTHELALNLGTVFGADLRHLLIDDVIHEVFHAKLAYRREGEELSVDCRPSDGLAIAARAGVPIYAEERVLERAGQS